MNHRDMHDTQDMHGNSLPPAAADTAFESALRSGLRHIEAPSTLAATLARAAAAEADRNSRSINPLRWFQRAGFHRAGSQGAAQAVAPRRDSVLAMQRGAGLWFAGAVTAALVVSAGVGGAVHERNRRASEAATRDFALSQQIEQEALAHTRTQLQQAGIDLGQ